MRESMAIALANQHARTHARMHATAAMGFASHTGKRALKWRNVRTTMILHVMLIL
jgi:hypothetical protein